MTTTDEAGLLRAVLLRPDDDLPRLIYADWLDEHDRPEHAEFIRETCEKSSLQAQCEVLTRGWSLAGRNSDPGLAAVLEAEMNQCMPNAPRGTAAILKRGFVSAVSLPLAAFVGGPCDRPWGPPGTTCHKCDGTGRTEGVAARLFAAHPVERVTLSCREPDPDVHTLPSWTWWEQVEREGGDPASNPAMVPDTLPTALFDRLPGTRNYDWGEYRKSYESREAALAALSDACVALGRERANLTNGGER